MNHKMDDDPELVCELTEALMTFRNETMEEINFQCAGIHTEALQRAFDKNPDSLCMSLNYGDTEIFIDSESITLSHSNTPALGSGTATATTD